VPRRVDLERLAERTFKSFYGPEEYQTLLVTDFYPIGWSRDGKFAYYIEPADEACGCYFGELIIQDLKTDKVLWHFRNDPDARVAKDGSYLDDDIRKLWRRNLSSFRAKLNQYRIVQSPRFSLLSVPFAISATSYSTKLTKINGKDEDGIERTRKLILDLSSSVRGAKTLYSEEFTQDDYSPPLDAAVAGVFKSPFEPRVAIVLLRVQRGWEGPPHVVDIQIVGSDLSSGFRKAQ
jgi:hypothetical protein